MSTLNFNVGNEHNVRLLNEEAAKLFAKRSFEEIERSVLDWLETNPSRFSLAAQSSPDESFAIDGWEEVYADLVNLASEGKAITAIGIDLTGHWVGDSPGFEVSFYDDQTFQFSSSTADLIAQKSSEYGAPWLGCFVELDQQLRSRPDNALYREITKYPQRFWNGAREDIPADFSSYLAAVWLLYLRVFRAIEGSLKSLGMPNRLIAVVGQNDFGPWFGTAFEVCASTALQSAAIEFEQSRQAENRARCQAHVNNEIAEIREQYRLLRMVPFYRFIARRKLGEMLDGQLGTMCRARGLPQKGVGWKMKKHKLESFLRDYAKSKNTPSIDDALDPKHTDALHSSWVEIARKKNFEFGQDVFSLFALYLGWALKFGGPILVDRWEHAKPYKID